MPQTADFTAKAINLLANIEFLEMLISDHREVFELVLPISTKRFLVHACTHVRGHLILLYSGKFLWEKIFANGFKVRFCRKILANC